MNKRIPGRSLATYAVWQDLKAVAPFVYLVATGNKSLFMSTKKGKDIKWFGMKLTPEQKQKIKQWAERRGVSQKKAVMDLVDEAVEVEPMKAKPGSFLDRNRDLSGIGRGPGDLSTNPKYLEGLGK